MTKQHITLLIPGLFDSIAMPPRAMPPLVALETLLARADQHEGLADSYNTCVLEHFDIGADRDHIPIAAVSRHADGGDRDGHIWMHIDPVYLNADKDRLILQGGQILEMDFAEAGTLLQELNTLYADDGWYFEAFHQNRWYARLPQEPLSSFHALSDVLGRSVEPFLPRGEDQTYFHRFMNEVQMLLHASTVNHQRAQQDKHPINSVWCWGPGKLPQQVHCDWHCVYANEPYVKGLAMLADTPVHAVPASADHIIAESMGGDADSEHHMLVVLEPSEEDMLSLDSGHYLEKISMLEERWFAPLLQAINTRRLASISLLGCDSVRYQLGKHQMRRFWRKRKRISLNRNTMRTP